MKIFLLFSILIAFSSNTVIKVRQPEFARSYYYGDGDSLRVTRCYNKQGEILDINGLRYIKEADTCICYMVYKQGNGYHYMNVIETHNNKILAHYRRINSTSWRKTSSTTKEILIENRNKIIATDSLFQEDITNPGDYKIIVTEYYSLQPRK